MDSSYLKDLLWQGREVEFDYGMNTYVVKLIDYRSTTEFSFGPKWGKKITSYFFDDIFYRREYGASLCEMLRDASSIRSY